jgi:hypothetical protein
MARDIGLAERHTEEKPQPGNGVVHTGCRDAIRSKMQLKAPHILIACRIGRAAEKHSQVPDAADVIVLGLRPEIADHHIFDHAPA